MKLTKSLVGIGVLLVGLTAEMPVAIGAHSAAETAVEQRSKGSKKSQNAKKTQNSKNSKKSQSSKKKASAPAKPQTSAEVQRQHENTRKEIKLTEEQIRANEAKIKKSLGDLNRINGEIEKTKVKVNDMAAQVKKLDSEITALETQIKGNEESLATMRNEYLKAVKKMRQSKQNQSTLAFIFSSDNFNQALRRMRYLRQFSEWKDKKSDEINRKVEQLKRQTALLEQTRRDKDRVLQGQVAAQRTLEDQGRKQDALVVELRKNGEVLKAHLSKKQAEANALKSRIATLIAAEQQKAAAEKASREAREREAREKAERDRVERERQEALKREAEEVATKEKSKEDKDSKKETKTKETKKTDKQPTKDNKKSNKSKDYADARKRKPRGDSKSEGVSKPSTPATPSKPSTTAPAATGGSGNFAAMRGSLPRPVDGAWRVTSRFGRHALPDLPDVMYDNPGIDAEVSHGATAKAVYGGKVTGVYMIPGFGTVVIVNHGDYFTVYGNLASVSVKSGDTVKQGQSVGKVGEDSDDPGHSSIHFEVWKNRDKQNPLEWIR